MFDDLWFAWHLRQPRGTNPVLAYFNVTESIEALLGFGSGFCVVEAAAAGGGKNADGGPDRADEPLLDEALALDRRVGGAGSRCFLPVPDLESALRQALLSGPRAGTRATWPLPDGASRKQYRVRIS